MAYVRLHVVFNRGRRRNVWVGGVDVYAWSVKNVPVDVRHDGDKKKIAGADLVDDRGTKLYKVKGTEKATQVQKKREQTLISKTGNSQKPRGTYRKVLKVSA